jgi:hypothetical protein
MLGCACVSYVVAYYYSIPGVFWGIVRGSGSSRIVEDCSGSSRIVEDCSGSSRIALDRRGSMLWIVEALDRRGLLWIVEDCSGSSRIALDRRGSSRIALDRRGLLWIVEDRRGLLWIAISSPMVCAYVAVPIFHSMPMGSLHGQRSETWTIRILNRILVPKPS